MTLHITSEKLVRLALPAIGLVVLLIALSVSPAGGAEPSVPAPLDKPVQIVRAETPPPGTRAASRRGGRSVAAEAKTSRAIVYTPPRRGSPRERLSGGVRSSTRALPYPNALVPRHVAHTIRPSPSLFWHIDGLVDEDVRVVFTIIDETNQAIEPLAEVELPRPRRGGIQRIRLADHGVVLRPEVEYLWSIALVSDREQRAGDVLTVGFIRRVKAPSGSKRDAAFFAQHGLWYDALESVSDSILAGRHGAAAREARNSLLRQASLDVAVD